MPVTQIHAALTPNGIRADAPDADIFARVMDEGVVLLKGVFPAEECRCLRDLAFEWGRSQDSSAQSDFYSLTARNHFCVESGISKIQKTLHFYRSHNFNDYREGLPEELSALLSKFCPAIKEFYNRLTGNAADFKGEQTLHPQIIHYPSGGGHFARHVHALEPQKVGVITSLSSRGADFCRGGTGFDVRGELVSVEESHDMGDIALFRYDLPHWVTPVDIAHAVDESSPRGRWTLIVPYY